MNKYEDVYNATDGKVTAASLGVFGKTLTHVDATRNVGQINLGVHWPEKLYKKTFKKDMDPTKVAWEDYGSGALVKGIVLSDEFGNPMGTKKLYREVSRSVVLDTTLASSSSELRPGQVKDMHKLARDAIDVSATRKRKRDADGKELEEEEDEITLQHKKMPRALAKEDSNTSRSVSCDWLRAPGKGGKALKKKKKTSSGSDQASSGGAKSKKHKAKSKEKKGDKAEATGAASVVPSSGAAGALGGGRRAGRGFALKRAPTSSPSEKLAAKRQQAINIAKTVILETRQNIDMAATIGIRTLTVAAWDGLKKKVESKLTPACLEIYQSSMDDIPDDFGDAGEEKKDVCTNDNVLEDLSHCQHALLALRPLIVAWSSTSGPEKSSMALLRAIHDAENLEWGGLAGKGQTVGSNNFSVHVLVKYEVVRRKLMQSVEEESYSDFADSLLKVDPEDGIVVLSSLPADKLVVQQERLVMSVYQALMRKASDVHITIECLKKLNHHILLSGASSQHPLEAELKVELEKFGLLLNSFSQDTAVFQIDVAHLHTHLYLNLGVADSDKVKFIIPSPRRSFPG